MKLQELVEPWQELIDKSPAGSRGCLVIRPDLFRQYRTPRGIYLIQTPDRDNVFHLADVPNGSELSEVTAMALYRYACTRLWALGCDLQTGWDCELMREDDGFVVASFFKRSGGRLTIHGIEMNKNWCGVI